MKNLIYNSIIPFKGFAAINIFGLIFVRKEKKEYYENNPYAKSVLLNHESIHTSQYKELLYIFYLPLYLLNYIINVFIYGFKLKTAYKNICFEREAYKFQKDMQYINMKRKHFAWIHYIIKKY